jgi:hypothetical protein
MKPQPFTLELSNCQLRHDGGAADKMRFGGECALD